MIQPVQHNCSPRLQNLQRLVVKMACLSQQGNFSRLKSFCLCLSITAGALANGTSACAQFPPPGQMPIRPTMSQNPASRGMPGPTGPAAVPKVSPAPQISTHQRLVQLATRHPVCIVVGEGLASSFVSTITQEEGPFQDVIMGAQVRGTQKTKAHTLLDFTPNNDAAKMLFVLKGTTENETIAQVQRAAVRSAGTFEFEMTKQIEFNGQNIRTWSPSAFMTIHQQNLGAATPVSNVPLLGPLANNIVLNVADQRKPMSEGIAAQRVTQQVAPQFNSNLDKVLAKLNDQLHGPYLTTMAQAGMLPSRVSTTTTQDAMLCGLEFQAPLAAAADASGMQPLSIRPRTPTWLVTRRLVPRTSPQFGAEPEMEAPVPYSLDTRTLRDRACLLIHASLAESLAERFHLAGREFTDTELMRLLGTTSPSDSGNAAKLYTLILDSKNPVFATFDNGEILLSIRLGIRPVLGPELPMHIIQLAVRPQLTADKIVLKPEVRSVEPAVKNQSGALGASATTLIRQAIEQRMQEYSFLRDYEISRQAGRESFPITIQSVTLVDGWLTATIEQPELPQSANADEVAGPL